MLPIEDGVYQVFPPPYEESHWERQVNLRIIPTAAWAGLLLAVSNGSTPLALLSAGALWASKSVWPLSGGPHIPIYRTTVEEA